MIKLKRFNRVLLLSNIIEWAEKLDFAIGINYGSMIHVVGNETLGALKRGSFSPPNNPNSDAERRKITAFILWASLHNMSLCPYWGVNEFAHDSNAKVNGNKELDQFYTFFDTIPIETIRESFFCNSITFQKRSFSEAIDNNTFQFDEGNTNDKNIY